MDGVKNSRHIKHTVTFISANNKSKYERHELPECNPKLRELVPFYVKCRLGGIHVHGEIDDPTVIPPCDELDAAIRAIQAHHEENNSKETTILHQRSWTILLAHALNHHLKLHTPLPAIPLCVDMDDDDRLAVPARKDHTKKIWYNSKVQEKQSKGYKTVNKLIQIGVESRSNVVGILEAYNCGTEETPVFHTMVEPADAPGSQPRPLARRGKRRRSL